MNRFAVLLVILLSFASPLKAQSIFTVDFSKESAPLALKSETARKVVDYTTTGILGGEAIVLIKAIKDAPDTKHAILCASGRVGVTMGATEILKRVIHRERPDGSDFKSTPSGHTALAAVMTNGKYSFFFPITVALGRQVSKRHYLTDTLFGAGLGYTAKLICPGGL